MQNQLTNAKTTANRKYCDYLVMAFLLGSFFVYGMFRAFELGNGRAIASVSSSANSTYWAYVIFAALLGWIVFELVMRLYYFFVSFSIFTFALPKKRAFYVFRFFFAIRTLVITGLSFLLYVSPVFVNYLAFLTLIVDFCIFVCVFLVLKQRYFKTLLAPFAWKALLRPFLIFETIIVLLQVGGMI